MRNIIRVIIAEDNADQRQILKYFFQRYPELKVIAEAESGKEALKQIQQLFPDVVFLDIDLPEMNGIDLVKVIQKKEYSPHFVFFTSYPQYAVEGYEVDALDYLVKPINPERLDKTIKKILQVVTPAASSLEQPAKEQENLRYLTIQINKHSYVVNVDEIIFIYVEAGVVYVQLQGVTGIVRYRSIKQMETELDLSRFVRVHRKYLINIDKIKEIVGWFKSSYSLIMKDKNETEILLSRRGAKSLRQVVRW